MKPQFAEALEHFGHPLEIGNLEGTRVVIEARHGLLLKMIGEGSPDHHDDDEETGHQ